ncbi:heavy-metal-associated domain-containing protein [Halalkalibacter krulwichiae]|uniref:Copper chaperone CopZ n=1 Tax=Halalkalibacter krulwichiae TaxID=199441 RepID=A0A1X9M9W2_9BACI|nr:heavy-metal-associated domain-containing protein [Halalkalibacter krulwichiae]ARK30198.1 Copper chaperone CopZ [Halalkalibacter krulwichiae]
MKTISVQIEKMSCGHCIPDVLEALNALHGVVSTNGNENTDIVTIEYDEQQTNYSMIEATVKKQAT